MNANVFLRADADTMAMKVWPPELREPGALDKCEAYFLTGSHLPSLAPGDNIRKSDESGGFR